MRLIKTQNSDWQEKYLLTASWTGSLLVAKGLNPSENPSPLCPVPDRHNYRSIYKLKNTVIVPSFYNLDNRFRRIKHLEGAKGLVLVQNPVELRG